MIVRNSAKTSPVYLNYRTTSNKQLPKAEDLPTLVSQNVMGALLKNENSPHYFTEELEYPVRGTGGIYTKEFFESFLNRLSGKPIPGNKYGHSYESRSDFYTVGGELKDNGKGKGFVYFKLFVPEIGYTDSNSGLIRDIEAGNAMFSLVTRPEYEMRKNEQTGEMECYFIASVGAERNDKVDDPAMAAQRVNSKDFYEEAKSLILNGQVNYKDKIEGDEIVHAGKVYYSTLRNIAARAGNVDPEIRELISLIDKNRNGRSKPMDREEALKLLKGLYANGQISVAEIAEGIGGTAPKFIKGLDDQIRNEADRKNADLAKQINERLGDDPLDQIEKLLNTRQENEKHLVQNKVREQVGTEKIKNGKGEEVDNPAYLYAMKMCNGKTGKALTDTLNSLKEDTVMQNLLASQADSGSGFNRIESGGKEKNEKNESVPATMEV